LVLKAFIAWIQVPDAGHGFLTERLLELRLGVLTLSTGMILTSQLTHYGRITLTLTLSGFLSFPFARRVLGLGLVLTLRF
jgi:hypothetical protein